MGGQRYKNYDKDVADPAISYDVLRILTTAVTKAITTAITNEMVPVAATPNNITYSSVINLPNNESFETKTKEGNYQWHLITKTSEGWKNYGISATINHADNILDLFKDCSVQFGLDNIMNIPTSGTGAVDAAQRTVVGLDHCNAGCRYYIWNVSL